MSTDKLTLRLKQILRDLESSKTLKGKESVICAVQPCTSSHGPRFLLEGEGNRSFLRMNSNSYLGLSFQHDIQSAEEHATNEFGTGPGAVRFISGTWSPHIELEKRLATFHGREAAMIFSSAYATIMGILPPLVNSETCVISDELNHNCIINAIRLAGPTVKKVYRHSDMAELRACLESAKGNCQRVIVVTDGIFSMRGDHAPLKDIVVMANEYDRQFSENVLVVVDDSHGVGAFGKTGRGTEEYEGGVRADLLVGTLGKAFGVNGGYVVTEPTIIDYLRETSPFYIYSNSITPSEAAAAVRAVEVVDSAAGERLLDHLRDMTKRFENGITALGFETIPGEHPVVPLMVRDTARTSALVAHLRENGVLATGLSYPVVPKGDEEIRFQISADHTEADIDEVLSVLRRFAGQAK